MAQRAILLAAVLVLAACGFHMRGHNLKGAGFAFHSIYVRTPAETPFIAALRQALKLNKLDVKPSPEQADLVLEIVSEKADKQILALSTGGHVLEYLLRYSVSLRAYDRQQQEWLPAREITQQRNFPYDDTKVLAKQQEELMFYQDMRSDTVQLVLRSLGFAKPPQPVGP
jgi:LPS-assembly lipoprotein